jgi:hypothetical protein
MQMQPTTSTRVNTPVTLPTVKQLDAALDKSVANGELTPLQAQLVRAVRQMNEGNPFYRGVYIRDIPTDEVIMERGMHNAAIATNYIREMTIYSMAA